MDNSTKKAIVALLPRYAHNRRAGWSPAQATGRDVTLSEYLLLRRVAMERSDRPISLDTLRDHALDPYSSADPFLDGLPKLVTKHLLTQSGNHYSLTPIGLETLTGGEHAANDYAASRIHLQADVLERLASVVDDLATRLHRAPEPAVKMHQDRVPLLRRFDPRQTAPVRLEYAMYALQRARDDAHISAWRAAGFRGPDIEVLTHIWRGEASTRVELQQATSRRLHPTHLSTLLDQLERGGLIAVTPHSIAITERGRAIREAIERETDRVYFAPWPVIDVDWVRDRLTEIAVGFDG